MNCLECQEQMQHRLDGEAVALSPLEETHLAACGPCREQHAAAGRLREALRAKPRAVPPADLARRLVTAVLRDRELRRRRTRLRLVYTSVLAASVVLVLLVSYLLTPPAPPVPNPMPPIIAQVPPEAEPKKVPETPEPVAPVPSLGARLADSTRDQVMVLLTAANPLDAVPFQPRVADLEPFDPAAQSLKQAGQEVTEGVQSVTRASRQAFAYFVRELPRLEVPQRN